MSKDFEIVQDSFDYSIKMRIFNIDGNMRAAREAYSPLRHIPIIKPLQVGNARVTRADGAHTIFVCSRSYPLDAKAKV